MQYTINKFPTKLGNLYFSRCPNTRSELESLKNYNLDCIWNLAEELKSVGDIEAEFSRKVILGDIEDYNVPEDFYKFVGQVFEVAAMLMDGKNVLVHCFAGRGRTSFALCCISLAVNRGALEDTFAVVKYNAHGPERETQKDMVKRFYKFLQAMETE